MFLNNQFFSEVTVYRMCCRRLILICVPSLCGIIFQIGTASWAGVCKQLARDGCVWYCMPDGWRMLFLRVVPDAVLGGYVRCHSWLLWRMLSIWMMPDPDLLVKFSDPDPQHWLCRMQSRMVVTYAVPDSFNGCCLGRLLFLLVVPDAVWRMLLLIAVMDAVPDDCNGCCLWRMLFVIVAPDSVKRMQPPWWWWVLFLMVWRMLFLMVVTKRGGNNTAGKATNRLPRKASKYAAKT